MTAGRFTVVEVPTAMKPTFLVVDLLTPTPLSRWSTHDHDAAWFMAGQMSEMHLSDALPPPYDLPGEPSEEPF